MISVIIQARFTSSRLPGKVLKEINGRPLLSYMFERVRAAENVDQIVLATSAEPSDDPVEALCQMEQVHCFRGNLDDVLDRYYQTAKRFKATTIIRLTGDCPLIDPEMIDTMINIYKNGEFDYVANTIPPKWTVPEGMDVEIFSIDKLEQVWLSTKKPSDREHVTFYFWNNPDKFSIYKYNLEEDLSQYRLTVDYPEDFNVVKSIIGALYSQKKIFTMLDIINYLDQHPNIYNLNKNIQSNQGWQSAFEKDKQEGYIT